MSWVHVIKSGQSEVSRPTCIQAGMRTGKKGVGGFVGRR